MGVLTISYGAERTFRVKEWNHAKNWPHSKKDALWISVPTRSCHALLMAGADFQQNRSRTASRRTPGAGGRISFTFRVHDKEKEEALYDAWVRQAPRPVHGRL